MRFHLRWKSSRLHLCPQSLFAIAQLFSREADQTCDRALRLLSLKMLIDGSAWPGFDHAHLLNFCSAQFVDDVGFGRKSCAAFVVLATAEAFGLRPSLVAPSSSTAHWKLPSRPTQSSSRRRTTLRCRRLPAFLRRPTRMIGRALGTQSRLENSFHSSVHGHASASSRGSIPNSPRIAPNCASIVALMSASGANGSDRKRPSSSGTSWRTPFGSRYFMRK